MIDGAAIAAWLPQSRWFASKGTASPVVTVRDQADLPGTRVTIAVVDATVGDVCDRYVVALSDELDAAVTPAFAMWLVRTVLAGEILPGLAGCFRGHPASPAFFPAVDATVTPLGGDASNTSLRLEVGGRQWAVKLLRRCRAGIQPEVEVGEFLAGAGWQGTPRFQGWLEHVMAGESVAIATVHEFAAGCTSAWDHLASLAGSTGLEGAGREEILAVVAAIGTTTAEMHRALASRDDLAAFSPESPTVESTAAEAARMTTHAEGVFDLATARLPSLPPAIAACVRMLLGRRGGVMSAFARFAAMPSSAALIRVHGDYHLGQILVRAPDSRLLVIDFEGEPGRTLDVRRRKTSVFKDVAGMCRSFDYLLRHLARTRGTPYRREEFRLLENAFLAAYRKVSTGHAWWPTDESAAHTLLATYALDKALYELAYELANRPDWVEVPLAALMDSAANGIIS